MSEESKHFDVNINQGGPMIDFALGVVATAALYTFWPSLGVKSSELLRAGLAWLVGKFTGPKG